jgi:hypothetical protein
MQLYFALQELLVLIIFLIVVQAISILGVRLIDHRRNATRLMIALSVYSFTIGIITFFLGRFGFTLVRLATGAVVFLPIALLIFKIASQVINLDESEIEP